MPNNYFQFKQFTVQQDKCAMKVCTDVCLFGATVASFQLQVTNPQASLQCLDIGTGTGLLSLMYAQKNQYALVDAVEIDEAASKQAAENFAASPWASRLHIFNRDILKFNPGKKYDLIISNPPFFEGDLRSADKSKNNAKHDTSLSLVQLLQMVKQNLNREGAFAVLLPYHRIRYFIEEAVKIDFHLTQQVLIKQTVSHDYFRGILFFSFAKKQLQNVEISIKDTEGNYSNEFTAALKDYYLYL